MPNNLSHSPADILRWLLIDMAVGSNPSGNGVWAWPIYAAGEPTSPDNVITLYDTSGIPQGRSMIDGATLDHYGFQVRVRSITHPVGWTKADALKKFLAESIYYETIHVAQGGDHYYLVYAVSKIGPVLTLGKDGNSARSLFTINASVSLRQLT